MVHVLAGLLLSISLWTGTFAYAQDELPPQPTSMPSHLVLERLPPHTSYNMAMQVTYGTISHFQDQVPPWIGFGAQAGWGRHIDGPAGGASTHRLGASVGFSAEGPVPLHYNLVLEPLATWDVIANQFLFGASIGPSLFVHSSLGLKKQESSLGAGAALALRFGRSQAWSRVGRRVFFLVEPKLRLVEGQLSPLAAVLVGSGWGR